MNFVFFSIDKKHDNITEYKRYPPMQTTQNFKSLVIDLSKSTSLGFSHYIASLREISQCILNIVESSEPWPDNLDQITEKLPCVIALCQERVIKSKSEIQSILTCILPIVRMYCLCFRKFFCQLILNDMENIQSLVELCASFQEEQIESEGINKQELIDNGDANKAVLIDYKIILKNSEYQEQFLVVIQEIVLSFDKIWEQFKYRSLNFICKYLEIMVKLVNFLQKQYVEYLAQNILHSLTDYYTFPNNHYQQFLTYQQQLDPYHQLRLVQTIFQYINRPSQIQEWALKILMAISKSYICSSNQIIKIIGLETLSKFFSKHFFENVSSEAHKQHCNSFINQQIFEKVYLNQPNQQIIARTQDLFIFYQNTGVQPQLMQKLFCTLKFYQIPPLKALARIISQQNIYSKHVDKLFIEAEKAELKQAILLFKMGCSTVHKTNQRQYALGFENAHKIIKKYFYTSQMSPCFQKLLNEYSSFVSNYLKSFNLYQNYKNSTIIDIVKRVLKQDLQQNVMPILTIILSSLAERKLDDFILTILTELIVKCNIRQKMLVDVPKAVIQNTQSTIDFYCLFASKSKQLLKPQSDCITFSDLTFSCQLPKTIYQNFDKFKSIFIAINFSQISETRSYYSRGQEYAALVQDLNSLYGYNHLFSALNSQNITYQSKRKIANLICWLFTIHKPLESLKKTITSFYGHIISTIQQFMRQQEKLPYLMLIDNFLNPLFISHFEKSCKEFIKRVDNNYTNKTITIYDKTNTTTQTKHQQIKVDDSLELNQIIELINFGSNYYNNNQEQIAVCINGIFIEPHYYSLKLYQLTQQSSIKLTIYNQPSLYHSLTLLDNSKQLTKEVREILTQAFYKYSSGNDEIKPTQIRSFLRVVLGNDLIQIDNHNIKYMNEDFDHNNDESLALEEFLEYYRRQSQSFPDDVLNNISRLGPPEKMRSLRYLTGKHRWNVFWKSVMRKLTEEMIVKCVGDERTNLTALNILKKTTCLRVCVDKILDGVLFDAEENSWMKWYKINIVLGFVLYNNDLQHNVLGGVKQEEQEEQTHTKIRMSKWKRVFFPQQFSIIIRQVQLILLNINVSSLSSIQKNILISSFKIIVKLFKIPELSDIFFDKSLIVSKPELLTQIFSMEILQKITKQLQLFESQSEIEILELILRIMLLNKTTSNTKSHIICQQLFNKSRKIRTLVANYFALRVRVYQQQALDLFKFKVCSSLNCKQFFELLISSFKNKCFDSDNESKLLFQDICTDIKNYKQSKNSNKGGRDYYLEGKLSILLALINNHSSLICLLSPELSNILFQTLKSSFVSTTQQPLYRLLLHSPHLPVSSSLQHFISLTGQIKGHGTKATKDIIPLLSSKKGQYFCNLFYALYSCSPFRQCIIGLDNINPRKDKLLTMLRRMFYYLRDSERKKYGDEGDKNQVDKLFGQLEKNYEGIDVEDGEKHLLILRFFGNILGKEVMKRGDKEKFDVIFRWKFHKEREQQKEIQIINVKRATENDIFQRLKNSPSSLQNNAPLCLPHILILNLSSSKRKNQCFGRDQEFDYQQQQSSNAKKQYSIKFNFNLDFSSQVLQNNSQSLSSCQSYKYTLSAIIHQNGQEKEQECFFKNDNKWISIREEEIKFVDIQREIENNNKKLQKRTIFSQKQRNNTWILFYEKRSVTASQTIKQDESLRKQVLEDNVELARHIRMGQPSFCSFIIQLLKKFKSIEEIKEQIKILEKTESKNVYAEVMDYTIKIIKYFSKVHKFDEAQVYTTVLDYYATLAPFFSNKVQEYILSIDMDEFVAVLSKTQHSQISYLIYNQLLISFKNIKEMITQGNTPLDNKCETIISRLIKLCSSYYRSSSQRIYQSLEFWEQLIQIHPRFREQCLKSNLILGFIGSFIFGKSSKQQHLIRSIKRLLKLAYKFAKGAIDSGIMTETNKKSLDYLNDCQQLLKYTSCYQQILDLISLMQIQKGRLLLRTLGRQILLKLSKIIRQSFGNYFLQRNMEIIHTSLKCVRQYLSHEYLREEKIQWMIGIPKIAAVSSKQHQQNEIKDNQYQTEIVCLYGLIDSKVSGEEALCIIQLMSNIWNTIYDRMHSSTLAREFNILNEFVTMFVEIEGVVEYLSRQNFQKILKKFSTKVVNLIKDKRAYFAYSKSNDQREHSMALQKMFEIDKRFNQVMARENEKQKQKDNLEYLQNQFDKRAEVFINEIIQMINSKCLFESHENQISQISQLLFESLSEFKQLSFAIVSPSRQTKNKIPICSQQLFLYIAPLFSKNFIFIFEFIQQTKKLILLRQEEPSLLPSNYSQIQFHHLVILTNNSIEVTFLDLEQFKSIFYLKEGFNFNIVIPSKESRIERIMRLAFTEIVLPKNYQKQKYACEICGKRQQHWTDTICKLCDNKF